MKALNPIHQVADWNGRVILRTRNVSAVTQLANLTVPWRCKSGFTYDRPLYFASVATPTVLEAIYEHLHAICRLVSWWWKEIR